MFNKMVSREMRALEAELAALKAEEAYLAASITEAKGAEHVKNLRRLATA